MRGAAHGRERGGSAARAGTGAGRGADWAAPGGLSTWGRAGEPTHPAYGASKAGLHAFGQSLAVALAPHGITVASVAPGYVATDMTSQELATARRRRHPRADPVRPGGDGRMRSRPRSCILASPEAEWASGAILDLNGASYLRT